MREGWQKVKGKSPWKQTGRDWEQWISIYRWRRHRARGSEVRDDYQLHCAHFETSAGSLHDNRELICCSSHRWSSQNLQLHVRAHISHAVSLII